jgi:fermentation-respiration switch protein FrsA (DUF1100 family)
MQFDLILVFITLAGLYGFLRWFERANVWRPSRAMVATPTDAGLPYEEVYVVTPDGVRIHGWYVPSTQPVAALLFCHGNGGNISWRNDSLRQFHSLGLSTFLFDYRGYGQSEGRLSEEGTYVDAQTAYTWLRQREPGLPLVLFGRSMGAAIAVDLATHVSADALIFESGFLSIRRIGEELFPWLPVRLFNTIHYDNLAKISQVTMPVLVIHSPDDDIVPYPHGQAIYEAANEPKAFFPLQGGHNEGHFITEKDYLAALDSFLAEYVTMEAENSQLQAGG